MTEIHGRRVTLRPVIAADAAGLAAILDTPDVARWWPAYDRARVEAEFLVPEDDVVSYAILDGDRLVGLIQTTEENEPEFRHASIDLFLARSSTARAWVPTRSGPWRGTSSNSAATTA